VIIYGIAAVLSLIILLNTMAFVHRLVLAICGDVHLRPTREGIWLVLPEVKK
jgi:hypothetical protein